MAPEHKDKHFFAYANYDEAMTVFQKVCDVSSYRVRETKGTMQPVKIDAVIGKLQDHDRLQAVEA